MHGHNTERHDTERRHRTGGGGRGHRHHGRGMRGAGGWQQADLPPADDAKAWLTGRLPGDWFVGEPEVSVDREEIVVVGELPPPEGSDDAAAALARIGRFREDSRDARMKIADEAELRYGRKVAWGAVPVMTRLRHDERRVLDTLVDAGVARSRSDALAWCVRLVGEHTDDWLAGLREAMSEVEKLRAEGPNLTAGE